MFSNRPEARLKWTTDSLSRNLQTYRYEPIQPYILRQFVRKFRPKYFFDIGANIGYYSLLIAAEKNCSKIFSYEPMPRTFAELKKNVECNNLSEEIVCHQLAISCLKGHSTMDVIDETSGSNALASTAFHNTKIVRQEHVSTTTLDLMHDFKDSKIAMKIDVEGHELEVIQGAQKLLISNPAILQIEIHNRSSGSRDAMSLLQKLGYRSAFVAGPDKYLTNDDSIFECSANIIEDAMDDFITDFKIPLYVKSRFLPGIGIELSPRLLKLIPSFMRPSFKRKLKH